jgi:hypothetical protein
MSGFQHAIAGGSGDLVVPEFQSPNFDLAAQTGWAVLRNGDAYFFNITAAGSVTSNTVIVKGSGDGIFVYAGAPAFGTLVLAITSAGGVDEHGNRYAGPGLTASAPGSSGNQIQIRPDLDAMLIYAAE